MSAAAAKPEDNKAEDAKQEDNKDEAGNEDAEIEKENEEIEDEDADLKALKAVSAQLSCNFFSLSEIVTIVR